jgi:hypothetical protein
MKEAAMPEVIPVDIVNDKFEWLEVVAGPAAGMVVSPVRRDARGRGVYQETAVLLVKNLRAEGVEAGFLDSSENRTFLVQKSADVAFAYVIGILSSASWAAIAAVFHRWHGGRTIDLTVYRVDDIEGTRDFFHASGNTDDVLKALGRATGLDDDQ